MKATALSLALALLSPWVTSTQAQAATVDFGPLGSGIESTVFQNAPGSFFDTVNFSVAGPSWLSISLADLEHSIDLPNGTTAVVFDNISLTGFLRNNSHPNGTETLGDLGSFNQTFAFLLPTAGNYHLDFSGTAVGVSGGLYSAAVAVSAVPEPETYALLMAGLGAVGFMARRRRQQPHD